MRIFLFILYFITFNMQLATCNLLAQQPMLEWVRRYPDTVNRSGNVHAMVLDDSSNVYVTGQLIINNSYLSYFCTIKYSLSGAKQWVSTYNNGLGAMQSNAIALDSMRNVYVAGGGNNHATVADYYIIKYTLNGGQQWVRFYDGPVHGADVATVIATDKAGNIYVSGNSSIQGSYGWVYTTLKYSPDGRQLWVQSYGVAYGSSAVNGIAIDHSCNIYITGEQYVNGGGRAVTVKYDSAGNQKWVRWYQGPDNRRTGANAITLDRNDNVYITGYSPGLVTLFDCFTIKYTSSGLQEWVRRFNVDSTQFNRNVGKTISVDKYSNVYVSGSIDSSNGMLFYFCTIKYSTLGQQLWVKFHTFGEENDATSQSLDSECSVYVAGNVSDPVTHLFSYGIVKYDSSGALKHAVQYGGPTFENYVCSIKLNRGNDIFVTGTSLRTGTGGIEDFCTIKYSQPIGIININSEIPKQFRLYQNYPNPFNTKTVIRYQLSVNSFVSLKIYDVLGNQISILVRENQKPGVFEVEFDGTNYSSGIYFYRLEVNGNIIDSKKLILLR